MNDTIPRTRRRTENRLDQLATYQTWNILQLQLSFSLLFADFTRKTIKTLLQGSDQSPRTCASLSSTNSIKSFNYSKSCTGGRKRRSSKNEPPTVSDVRLVIVGRTGAGKSSSGNTILGRDAFRAAASHSSVTVECTKQQEKLSDRTVTLVDTPGIFDTSEADETVKREISKCINMSAPGPHAILLVIKVGPFSAEERDAVKKVEEIFGKEAWKYTIILFTHGDKVDDIDQAVQEAGEDLKVVLEKAGKRYHIFNNCQANDRRQVLDLLQKVDTMVDDNGGQCYSNITYLEAVKMLDQRESELREVYQKKLEEGIKSVESKYEKLLSEAQQEREQVEKRLQSELEEVKRYYHALESGVRHVVEQIGPAESFDEILNKFHETLKLN
ncbi:GTPase IMAP family member 9-like [Embiotoca jacksoni]|uniref:GTPase IMAP family member 9-like n=1 Tax=Embiotoca jacksoni TaxID=100190 RepID=UPI0037044911